ncbi:MAG: hypothetical protein CML19_18190 [Pusillimonas sp.]|jgi:hypothetical protein|nr:hypothetical protein [Pusillimonas sp.]|tara:strand:- start:15140 stop:15472 length:333 start_codon:yes stop_codon:yes gene_type:complete
MKYKFVDRLEVIRDVRVRVPAEGSGFDVQTFRARFRMMDTEAARALEEAAGDDFALLNEVFVGLPDGIEGENGMMEDSAETRQMLARVPYVRLALIQAFTDAQMGIERKN